MKTARNRKAIAVIPALLGRYLLRVAAKTSPNGEQSQSRFRPGAVGVISERFEWRDDTRPSPAYNRFKGTPYRILKGEVWRPAAKLEAGPLLVYCHGFMSNRREGLYLARFLASHGYTVVAFDFPLTSRHAPDKPNGLDIVNQPGDVRFVLDQLLARNANPNDALFETIDPDRIAAVGLSLGCLTSMLTTFHQELRDPRIKAAICIGGPTSMFSSRFFANPAVPTLMVYADTDSIVPYAVHALTAFERIPDCTLLTLKMGSHAGFAQQASTLLWMFKNPDSIACLMFAGEKSEDALRQFDFPGMLGGQPMGILDPGESEVPTKPLVKLAMKASRQHMFTTLAAHAFLDSVFAKSDVDRKLSSQYLVETLEEENSGELKVSPKTSLR